MQGFHTRRHGAPACANSHSPGQAGFSACSGVPSFLSYYLCLFLPGHRAYVSVSNGFPVGIGFLGNPALKGLRSGHLLSVSTIDENQLESYPVPMLCFAYVRFALSTRCRLWVKRNIHRVFLWHHYLLVKLLSLFSLLSFMMVLSRIRFTHPVG